MTQETVSYDPATGEIIGRSPVNYPEDALTAVRLARRDQPAWAAAPLSLRIAAVRRIKKYVVEFAADLADTIARDTGKTRLDALTTEVLPAALAADYYARLAKSFLAPRRPRPGKWFLANKRSKVVRVPYGVTAVISPWNYPFVIPFSEAIMALLAGNAVILKTATETQMAGLALKRCFEAARMPEGVFQYLNLPGPVAGAALLEAGLDKLFFTGSTAAGKKLMAKAAETLTPVCLELGGNDAMLVCPDADLDRAAAGAVWGGMQNCGQTCAGVERIYVHYAVYEDFLRRLGSRVRALRIGPDTDHNVDVGAMTTRKQMETVRAHVADALAKGARIYARSDPHGPAEGNWLPALVLTGVDHSMLVMREETFGPVLGVMPVADMDRAVALANDSTLGLTGSVWSRNVKEADRLARLIQAGVVTVNDHLMSHGLPETPWGGFKQSGIGRTHGAIGFEEMTQAQCIVHDVLPWVKRDLWWHPQSPELYRGFLGIKDLLFGHSIAARLRGVLAAKRILPRMFRTDRTDKSEGA